MKLTSAAVLLVLLLAAGCGGDDSSFARDYNRAVRPISELHGRPGPPSHYDRLARRARQTSRNLSGVSPPDGAQDELDAVRKGLDSVADDFDRIASARRQRDAGRQVAATHALRRDIRFYERAERALKRAVEG